jgi:stage IV sporulation protein FB
MNLPEPNPSRYDLHGRLCGVPLRIHPFFWSSVAALGIRYYADPEAGSLGYFAFWFAAVLGCVLLHALSQIFVGRLFGMRGAIVLYSLGSLISGVDNLPQCWQRVVVPLAGPIAQFVLVGCIWGLAVIFPFPVTLSDWGYQAPIATGAAMLVRINLHWGLLNVLPLWPLAGGRISVDVGETLGGRTGRIAALILSLVVIALISVWAVFETSWYLNFRYDPRYVLHLEEGIVWLLFCFVLWTRNFAALWSAAKPRTDTVWTAAKHSAN